MLLLLSYRCERTYRMILEKPIETIMKTNVITGHPLDFVEEVAAVFYEHQISCLPIVKEHKLVGIITETDLITHFS